MKTLLLLTVFLTSFTTQASYVVSERLQSKTASCEELSNTFLFGIVGPVKDKDSFLLRYTDVCTGFEVNGEVPRVLDITLYAEARSAAEVEALESFKNAFDGQEYFGTRLRFQKLLSIHVKQNIRFGKVKSEFPEFEFTQVWSASHALAFASDQDLTRHVELARKDFTDGTYEDLLRMLTKLYTIEEIAFFKAEILPESDYLMLDMEVTYITENFAAIEEPAPSWLTRDCRESETHTCSSN